jgi:hypothetical protein
LGLKSVLYGGRQEINQQSHVREKHDRKSREQKTAFNVLLFPVLKTLKILDRNFTEIYVLL